MQAAVVKTLEWKDAFAIFAQSDIPLLRSHYKNTLRPQLSASSQCFWDTRVNENFNFMYSGTSGLAAWVLVHVILPVLGLGFIRSLVKAGVTKVVTHFPAWYWGIPFSAPRLDLSIPTSTPSSSVFHCPCVSF